MKNFKIGSRVYVLYDVDGYSTKGKVGVIIGYSKNTRCPLVEFDKNINGHNGKNRATNNKGVKVIGKSNHCLFCDTTDIKMACNISKYYREVILI